MGKNRAFIITNPMIAANRSAEVTLSKLLRVIRPCYEELAVIGGNLSVGSDLGDVTLHSYPIRRSPNKLKRMLDVALLQLKMLFATARLVKRGETVYFWLGDKMLLPYLAAKLKGGRVHYFIYGNVEREENAGAFIKLSGKLIRFMAEHAHCVCVESPSVLTGWPGLRPRAQKVIHLYTDHIQMNDPQKREKVIGMVCRMAASKRVEESIRAFANIHRDHPDWRLEIIGSGKLESQCRTLIGALAAEDFVTMHGWVEHGEMLPITQRWTYLLFPTDYEGLPNGLIEMMGQGIPAIASPVGGIRDVVIHGKNGLFLEDNSVRAIQRGIETAIAMAGDPNLPLHAYQTIDEKFRLSAAQRQAAAAIAEN